MKNIITVLLCCIASLGVAQKQKGDTLVLSVYNNNTRYMLTLADFGPDELTQSIMGEMVAAYDTLISIKGKADSTKNKAPRFDITRSCDKPLGDVKDKIVIMDLNKDCDVTKMCLNVQKAGAKAFVIVHNSNSNGNIKLPKQGAYKDSIRIPIFTIRKGLGEKITTMMPSLVGISLRRPQVQALASSTVLNMEAPAEYEKSPITWVNNTSHLNDSHPNDFSSTENVKIFPNPTDDVLNLTFKGYTDYPTDIIIYDMQGKQIWSQHIDEMESPYLSIPIADKTVAGQYMIYIKSKGRKDVIRTFTVSK